MIGFCESMQTSLVGILVSVHVSCQVGQDLLLVAGCALYALYPI